METLREKIISLELSNPEEESSSIAETGVSDASESEGQSSTLNSPSTDKADTLITDSLMQAAETTDRLNTDSSNNTNLVAAKKKKRKRSKKGRH